MKISASKTLRQDVVAGSRVLAMYGVLDAFGHVSARSDRNPERFIISRSLAPALVTDKDLMELDVNSEPLPGEKRKAFLERFIHGEIYRVRPDVKAVVHSHAPSVIPFGVAKTGLRPVFHMAGFLWSGVPTFEIRKSKIENDLLIRDRPLGAALAESLGACTCVLMRGHGMTIVGESVAEAVFRSIYTETNAKLQLQAMGLEGPIEFLSDAEGKGATKVNQATLDRPWELWKKEALKEKSGRK